MKKKITLAAFALAIAFGLSILAKATPIVHTHVYAIEALGAGDECLTTKRTKVTVKVIGVPCESVKADATHIDHEIANLARRLGAKRDIFEGAVVTLTPHHIMFPWNIRPGVFVHVIAHGVTRRSESVVRWGVSYEENPYDVLAHELGHVAWNRIGLDSSFLDGATDSPEKRAIMSRKTNRRMLPKDHLVVKNLRAL